MKVALSTPVQILLAVTLVTSTVAILQPTPVDLPSSTLETSASRKSHRLTEASTAETSSAPWERPQASDPIEADAEQPQTAASDVPPLPQGGLRSDSESVPPLPAGSVSRPSPTQDIVYLGRMIRDGKTQVFLSSSGTTPVVLSSGEVFNGSWKIQSISSTAITLTHLHTGESRVVAMGGGSSDSTQDHPTTQVGQRFLTSNPAGVYAQPVN